MLACLEHLPFKSGDRILFQGDSLTAADRDFHKPWHLGNGYVAIIAGLLAQARPDLRVEVLNRGVGGNRSAELLARWDADCLQLHPTWLSIMIGVNDVWRLRLPPSHKRYIPLDEFVVNYRQLLDTALAADVEHLVLVSPTLIELDMAGELNQLVAEYDEAVAALARQYEAIYVPLRQHLIEFSKSRSDLVWLRDPVSDGCHFNTLGHAVAAITWLTAVCEHTRLRGVDA
ncbi:MAG TPA: SGNH/GDSL hydrolase family protein [Firmicutes bacterium]|jgi:acyl-CoA thioesterase-1|nr:SGNH/GDSL hydrolase family protein [Bacillota bacterium]